MAEANGPIRTVTAPDGQPVSYTADRGPVTPDGVHAAVPALPEPVAAADVENAADPDPAVKPAKARKALAK